MLLLLAELEAKPEFAGEVEAILRKLVETTAEEPGNLVYAVHRPEDRPHSFIVYELYRDRAACDAHLQSDPLQQALRQFERMLAAPPKLTFGSTVATTPLPSRAALPV